MTEISEFKAVSEIQHTESTKPNISIKPVREISGNKADDIFGEICKGKFDPEHFSKNSTEHNHDDSKRIENPRGVSIEDADNVLERILDFEDKEIPDKIVKSADAEENLYKGMNTEGAIEKQKEVNPLDDNLEESLRQKEQVANVADGVNVIEDETENKEGDESEKKGGSYGEIFKGGEGDKYEVHHMPADSTTELDRNDGPAIKMEKEDHRQTASCGSSREAREYMAKQKELIDQGKFREALQMDIDDIHEKFGDKYDDAIAEMLEYVDKLEAEGKIDG